MIRESLSWTGITLRLIAALLLVYASYNPTGYSYFHWVEAAFTKPETPAWYDTPALKFLVGVILFTVWLVFLNATRHSLGLLGVALVLSLCGGAIWLLAEWDVFSPDNIDLIIHLTLIVAAIVLTVGMCWSHVNRRLSGQVDTDEVG